MPFDPTFLTYLQAAQTGAGLLGTLLGSGGGDLRPEQRQVFEMLKKRSRGLSPETLELMRQRARETVGNEGAGIAASTRARLTREGVPIGKREEVLDTITKRRIGGAGEAMTNIDLMNEQIRSGALDRLSVYASGLGTEPLTGGSWAELLGQGLGGLEASLLRDDFYKKLEELMAQNNRRSTGNAPSDRIGVMGSYD